MADDTTKGGTIIEKGTVLYIAANRGTHGITVQDPGLMILQRKSKGTEDISYHGSPTYEDFVVCTDPKTGKEAQFGSQDYHWCDALGEIDGLKDELHKIHAIAAYV